MMNVRLWHSYLAVLIAPSVLFFALTGALQLFSLHEAHAGYQPAAVIEKLGRVHKDQVFALSEHHDDDHHNAGPANAAAAGAPSAPDQAKAPAGPEGQPADGDDGGPPVSTLLLKWYFLVVALGLVTTTGLGLWIAFTRTRGLKLVWGLLATGIVLPLLLLVV
jgi:hypothetical protein